MTRSGSSIDSWIQIGSAVAAAQLLANSLKNFRTARRLVPIGSISPSMIEECRTIPLCFVGSEHRLTRGLLWAYARLWIRRSSTKQAFLCDEITFSRAGGDPLPRVERLKPGNRVQATLAIGESVSHARRSAIRSAVGSELVLAIVSRTGHKDRYRRKARCITVRARSSPRQDGSTTLPTRRLEWEVINPTGVGARADARRTWERTPTSAVWLIAHETRDGKKDRGRIQSGQKLTVMPFYASGSSPWPGFGSAVVRTVGRVGLIGLFFAVLIRSEWAWNAAALWQYSALGILFYMNILIFRHVFSFAFKVKSPVMLSGQGQNEFKLPWHGATTRSLALGDRLRKVALVEGLRFQFWEPTTTWIQSVYRRFDSVKRFPR